MPWSKLFNLMGRQRHKSGMSREESIAPTTTVIVPLYIYPEPGAWKPLHTRYVCVFDSMTPYAPRGKEWRPRLLQIDGDHALVKLQAVNSVRQPPTGTRLRKTADELTLLTGLNSIQSHGNAHFVVIVNPGNGPGPDVIPDDNYLREIPLLTAYPNVDVVGYVHTTFAQRDLSAVTHDIQTYSNWAQQGQHPGLGISGIFVDETPNQYDARAEKFLSHLTEFAKSCHGFAGDKLVIHNPGCVPAPAYLALADMTVVFEDTWQNFTTRLNDGVFDWQNVFGGDIAAPQGNFARNNVVIMIHSVPRDLNSDKTKKLVGQLKYHANAVFITDLDRDYYSNWSPNWTNWVKSIATTDART